MNEISIPFDDPLRAGMISQIGLVTSQDKNGVRNIMAAEWAYQISFTPAYFTVHIGHSKKTLQNLKEYPYFGISTVAADHGWISSVAGNSHGDEVDKIGALMELGVEFREHDETKIWTVQDAAIEMVLESEEFKAIGDHTMVIGRVVWVHRGDMAKKPLLYYLGKYFAIGEQQHKPDPERMDEISRVVEKYKKS